MLVFPKNLPLNEFQIKAYNLRWEKEEKKKWCFHFKPVKHLLISMSSEIDQVISALITAVD